MSGPLSAYSCLLALNPDILRPAYIDANARAVHLPPNLEHSTITFWTIAFDKVFQVLDFSLHFIPQHPGDDSLDSPSRRKAIDGVIVGFDADDNHARVPVLFYEAKRALSGRAGFKAVREQLWQRFEEYIRSPNHPTEFIYGVGAVGTMAAIWLAELGKDTNKIQITALTVLHEENGPECDTAFIDADDSERGGKFMTGLDKIFIDTRDYKLARKSYGATHPGEKERVDAQNAAVRAQFGANFPRFSYVRQNFTQIAAQQDSSQTSQQPTAFLPAITSYARPQAQNPVQAGPSQRRHQDQSAAMSYAQPQAQNPVQAGRSHQHQSAAMSQTKSQAHISSQPGPSRLGHQPVTPRPGPVSYSQSVPLSGNISFAQRPAVQGASGVGGKTVVTPRLLAERLRGKEMVQIDGRWYSRSGGYFVVLDGNNTWVPWQPGQV